MRWVREVSFSASVPGALIFMATHWSFQLLTFSHCILFWSPFCLNLIAGPYKYCRIWLEPSTGLMETYDIIFAGGETDNPHSITGLIISLGGSTACVTAGRLIAANPALRILVRANSRRLQRYQLNSNRFLKQVLIPKMYLHIYSLHGSSVILCLEAKRCHSM